MAKDMIVVFNSLTNARLVECKKFENILSSHFEKFRYFYDLIKDIDILNVQQISCTESNKSLNILVTCKTKKLRDQFNKLLKKENQDCLAKHPKYKKCFKLLIETDKNDLNISIENNENYREEDDYAD